MNTLQQTNSHHPQDPHLPDYEAIFQASIDCLKIIDHDGILKQICRSGSVALEYDGECPALGTCWFDFWDPAMQNLAHRAVAQAQEQGFGHFVGSSITFKGNLRWWDVLVSPLRSHSGRLFFLVASRDISRLKQQERENLQAIYELERERLNREQFVATLTHDMRNPLSAARTSAQLIIRKTAEQERLQSLATRIDRCLERADAMITDLLDAAQIRAGKTIKIGVEPVDLKILVEETLHDLSLTAGPRFALRCNVPYVDALCNHHAFRRILENLASNALKYGDPTTQVTVSLERKPREVLLRVHNYGPHIGEDDCKTLFDIYRRTATARSGKQSGWGLGLTVVRGLSQALGGDASVESSAEGGTTFTVLLPQPPEQEVNVTRVAPGETESALGEPLRTETEEIDKDPLVSPEHAPRWLETVLGGIADAVVGSTADGRISFLNRAAQELSGYSSAEGCGVYTRAVLRRLDGGADQLQDYVEATSTAEDTARLQMLLVDRQNVSSTVSAQVTPLYDDAGSALGLVYIFRRLS